MEGTAVNRWLTALTATVGLALLAVAVWQVAAGDKGGDHAILIVVGAVLLLLSVFAPRIKRFGLGMDGVDVELAETVTALGAPDTAEVLRRKDLTDFATAYAFVYRELSHPAQRDVRVYLLDLLVDRAADIARTHRFRAAEVHKLFHDGPPMVRVLALGLMQGDSSLVDPRAIYSAINDSRSGNEQYHGLKLAVARWSYLSQQDRDATLTAIEKNPYIADDEDRRKLADQIRALDENIRNG
jgi:hypothetical protein